MILMGLTKRDKTRILYKASALFSLTIIIVVTSYGLIMSFFKGIDVVGQTFVDVEFPPIHVFPIFYMKPITWLNFAIILFTYSSLELSRDRIARLTEFKRSLIKVIAFVVAALTLYEVLFNFTLWSGLIASNSLLGELNPDLIINPFPNPQSPWNIVFATKLYLAGMIVSAYLLWFLRSVEGKVQASP